MSDSLRRLPHGVVEGGKSLGSLKYNRTALHRFKPDLPYLRLNEKTATHVSVKKTFPNNNPPFSVSNPSSSRRLRNTLLRLMPKYTNKPLSDFSKQYFRARFGEFAKQAVPQTYVEPYITYSLSSDELFMFLHTSYPILRPYLLLRPAANPSLWRGSRAYRFYPLDITDYLYNNRRFTPKCKVLVLNYTRMRFFPVIRTVSGNSYVSASLGLFAVLFQKGKAFIKSKTVFMALVGFLRKVLIFSSIKEFMLIVQKTPRYLQETLAALNEPVVNVYKDPFGESIINEKKLTSQFSFDMFLFKNNKAFGVVKMKQRGRLKRKITRRVISMNRVLD